jgi:type I restriction enzyme S subunit
MVEWETVELGCVADIYRGGSPRPIQSYLTTGINGVNWIKIGDVLPNEKYINVAKEQITTEGVSHSRIVNKGDFILSNSMSFGRPYILNIDGCIHDGWLAIQNYQNSFDTDFLYYVLCSETTLQQYASMAAGSSVQNLTKEKVSRILVCKPPKSEQRRIAEALSDTDTLIAALEKLIAKKRAIKQGAMQELLTGKRRLPGFCGEWVEQIMSNCLVFEVGYPFKSELFNQNCTGLRLVKNRDLKSDDQIFYTTEEYNQSYIVQNGDVLIGMDGDFIPCLWSKGIALLNQRVGRIKVINIDKIFAYYILIKPLESLQYGTGATTVKHLSHTNVEILQINIPTTFAEQTAIASILSNMDAEIDSLKAKLNKLKYIKQGMMAELLTGRIRLIEQEVIPEVDTATKIKSRPRQKTASKTTHKSGHNQHFDDAVMIAGIVNALYSEIYPLGRKKVQKCLYLLRRHQDESTAAFKKKAAGPYADEVRYKGGEPIAQGAHYIITTTVKGKGTTFARGNNISQALGYIESWGKQSDIQWLTDKLKYKKIDELELLATVDMAICDLEEAGIAISVASIKHLIATNKEWTAKLQNQTFNDTNIARAIKELKTLL